MALYYTDPLIAAYMGMEFGVKYLDRFCIHQESNGGYMTTTITTPTDEVYRDEVYRQENGPLICRANKPCIHPDSYHIFEPQVEDLVWNKPSNEIGFIKKIAEIEGHPASPQLEIENVGSWWIGSVDKIIQRNNKQFFMPESEDV